LNFPLPPLSLRGTTSAFQFPPTTSISLFSVHRTERSHPLNVPGFFSGVYRSCTSTCPFDTPRRLFLSLSFPLVFFVRGEVVPRFRLPFRVTAVRPAFRTPFTCVLSSPFRWVSIGLELTFYGAWPRVVCTHSPFAFYFRISLSVSDRLAFFLTLFNSYRCRLIQDAPSLLTCCGPLILAPTDSRHSCPLKTFLSLPARILVTSLFDWPNFFPIPPLILAQRETSHPPPVYLPPLPCLHHNTPFPALISGP